MSVPAPLKEFIDGANGSIARAGNLDVTHAARIAEVNLRTVKSYVIPTPALNEAFDNAIGRVADFHEEVVDQNTLIERVTPAIENARQIALLAIDRLAEALAEAKPNELAVALGLEWF